MASSAVECRLVTDAEDEASGPSLPKEPLGLAETAFAQFRNSGVESASLASLGEASGGAGSRRAADEAVQGAGGSSGEPSSTEPDIFDSDRGLINGSVVLSYMISQQVSTLAPANPPPPTHSATEQQHHHHHHPQRQHDHHHQQQQQSVSRRQFRY